MGLQGYGHSDTAVLEQALEQALAALQAGDPLRPVWIVTPTRRLRRQLQRRLAAERPRLGVSFLEPAGLAQALARRAGLEARPRLSPLAAAVLARRALAELPQARPWSASPGSAPALLAAFRDLREAGFGAPEQGEPRPDGSRLKRLPQETQLLLECFRRWRLQVLVAGWEDEFDFVLRLRQALEAQVEPPPPLLFFGFSELVGRWRRLLRSLARRGEIRFYAHVAPGPEFAAAQRLLQSLPLDGWAPLPGDAPPPPRAQARSLRGAPAELDEALRQALAWHGAGLPLEQIALVARSLAPYLPALGTLLPRLRLEDKLDSPAELPLRLDPAGAALQAGFRGFADAAPLRAAMAAAAERPAAEEALRRAWHDAGEAAARWPGEDPAALLAEALELAVVRPYERRDGAGLSLLDFQQARGLRFRRVLLLGLHVGSVPRPLPESCFLPDAARSLLSQGLPDALPSAADQRADELLLLQLALRTAVEELQVLRQHADADGTAIADSPARRAVERFLGAPLQFAAVPSDPLAAAARRVRAGAALPEEACLALAEPGPADSGVLEALARGVPAVAELLGPAPGWVRCVDAYAPVDLRFDGAVAADGDDLAAGLSVSRLEDYGRQPLAAFFEHWLRVPCRAWPPRPGPGPDVLGSALHEVLQAAAGDPAAALEAFDGRVAPLFAGAEAAEYLAHECARWRDALQRFLEWDRRRLAGGGSARDAQLGGGPMEMDPATLELRLDQELELQGARLRVRGRLDRLLRAPGRLRVSDYKTGRVEDASSTAAFLQGRSLQNALYLLLLEPRPEFAGARWSAEAVRLHPDCDYAAPTAAQGGYGSGMPEADWAAARAGIVETAAVLAAQLRAGHFPAFRDQREHRWDRWFNTTRLGHPPSERRVASAPAWTDLFRLSAKRARKWRGAGPWYLLAELPAAAGRLEEEVEEEPEDAS